MIYHGWASSTRRFGWEIPTLQCLWCSFYCVWVGIGFNVVLLGGAMGRIPDDLIEYGNLEGIGLTTELFRVVIPMVWPTIGTLLVTGTTSAFYDFYAAQSC